MPADARVLSLGGDGTLHEIAAACVHTRRVVGILPGGSGDDLAYALNIRRDDLKVALDIVEAGCVARVDTGLVNGETFINAFGVGFDADVAYRVRHAPRLLKERSAYLYAVVTTLGRLEHVPVEVVLDGKARLQRSRPARRRSKRTAHPGAAFYLPLTLPRATGCSTLSLPSRSTVRACCACYRAS